MLTVKDTVYLNDKAVVMCGSFCSKYKWEKSTDDGNNWSTLTETGSVITVTLDELKSVDYKCTLDSSCGVKQDYKKDIKKYDTMTIYAPKGKTLYSTSFNPQNLQNIIKKVAKISITQIIIELVCQNNRILLFFDIPQILQV